MTVNETQAILETGNAPSPRGGAAGTPEMRPRRYPQTRALEVHLPEGFEIADAPRLVWQIHRAGFNTILLNCFRHGWTAHDSPVMRSRGFPCQHPQFRGSDPVAAILSAARAEGLAVYALVEGLRVGDEGRRRGRSPILRRRPDWAVRGRAGAGGPLRPPYLCPVNRDVWRFLGDLFYEILEGYPFRGLYLRHIHFPVESAEQRADYCVCEYCRKAIWRSLGVHIPDIPDDPDHPDRYNLTSWRSKQLVALLHYLQLRLAKVCAPSLTLAEVHVAGAGEEATPEAGGYADACAWVRNRLLPIAAVRPLPGVSESNDSWLAQVAALAECALVMPVLSAEAGGRLIETLDRLRPQPLCGVVVREPHDLAAPPLNQLACRLWRETSDAAEERPLRSVCALLEATIRLLPPDSPLSFFLQDVLRVVEPLGEQWPAQQCETLFENLLGLEERIVDGKMDLGPAASAVLRNFRLARHLLRLAESEL